MKPAIWLELLRENDDRPLQNRCKIAAKCPILLRFRTVEKLFASISTRASKWPVAVRISA